MYFKYIDDTIEFYTVFIYQLYLKLIEFHFLFAMMQIHPRPEVIDL